MQKLDMAVAGAVLLLAVFSSGCLNTAPIRLNGTEIREYQGQRLDSAATAFVENSINGPQHVNLSTYTLQVTGLVESPKSYTYDELVLRQSYEKVVTLYCVEGWDATILWQGILVKDLIREAGPRAGANTVIFYAYDGYSTSFPLSYVMGNDIIMAYRMNGVTLPPERGFPFQLVAEDKWGYKWIKWVTKIEVSADASYEGYWESRGYSNSGNLNESFTG
jgi:DMSO/TMAO reductase YedYZ molybdopterin-dependent catalytic subunit